MEFMGRISMALQKPHKPVVAEFVSEAMSSHLHDLQALMTASARCGRGGFLWCGWNCTHWSDRTRGRKTVPQTGAQLCLITAKCARKLLPIWHSRPDSHMGTFFYRVIGLEFQDELEAYGAAAGRGSG